MAQIQKRNPELVQLLRADFLHLNDPPRTRRVTTTSGSVSSPPTNAELDALFGDPNSLPENSFFFLWVSDLTEMYLIVPVYLSGGNWWYEQLTLA